MATAVETLTGIVSRWVRTPRGGYGYIEAGGPAKYYFVPSYINGSHPQDAQKGIAPGTTVEFIPVRPMEQDNPHAVGIVVVAEPNFNR